MDPDPLPFLSLFFLIANVVWIQLGLALLLLICSALVSGAEVAFFSLQLKSLEELYDTNNETEVKRVIHLLRKPKRLLATVLVANNFINIAIVLLFSLLSKAFLSDIENPVLLLIIEVGIITFIILIFGEILPKVYANRNALTFSKVMAPVLIVLDEYLLFWLTFPMSRTTTFIEKRLGDKGNQFSIDKLSQALELTGDDETTSDEQRILEGIVNFGNTDTREVMCPRMDMFAISDALTMKEIIPLILEQGYSRIPIYTEKKDTIKGILYVKDLLPNIHKENFKWQQLLKQPLYVPENKKLDDLLKEFQLKKNHLAIVVDEYGGTSGLITLEDIMEEIVGDISDEFDEVDSSYSKLDDLNYLFEAKISLKDFFKVIHREETEEFELIKGDAETLAGLLLEIVKKFPKKKQIIRYAGYSFRVEEIDQMRITQVKVTLPKE
ncbi:MAG: gliding motility-associated protein GldE [Flavobacteriaceae bacterium]|nr:gliding motility-associated protein GldE [Flavobacteriaceae bacterium]MBT4313601.1 gliding motility-associated protein GldE [Flavobacteriaceae bacterium]MBT5091987.1 gliding motility-associated protein GldE [Flavobacteriaceae bacterium]MBT5284260.1 gliding motility-associated protein GldE [Flavobacteriaceae bacterium]MBT5446027.1 gliding motility-associated protein GldE [Flavobacteriaceae bacterium]